MPGAKVLAIDTDEAQIRYTIARSLAAISRVNRLSRADIARIAGCSTQTISNAMNERFTLNALIIARLTRAFPEFRWQPATASQAPALARQAAQAKAFAQGHFTWQMQFKVAA